MNEILIAVEEDIPPQAPSQPPTRPIVLQRLWKHRGLLFKSSLAGLVLSTIIAFCIPKEYKSTTQVMPPESRAANAMSLAAFMGSPASQVSSAASSLLGMPSPEATFIGILTSQTVKDDLINQFDLRRVYHVKSYTSARKKLESRTSIAEDKKTGNLTISVIDRDPYRARALSTAYLAELNRLIAQLSTSSARREREFLEGRLKSVKQDLDSATQDLSVYSSRNATLAPDTQEKAELDAVARVQADLISSESELQGLETTYGRDNVRVRSMEARVAELRSQLQKMTGSKNENSAALEDGQLLPSVRKLPLLGTTYYELYRRAAVQDALYEMLTKQYEIAKVEEARDIPTVRVLDPPDLPEKKSFPPRTLIVLFGTLLAFGAGFTWVSAFEAWETTDPADARKAFATQVWNEVCASLPWKGQKAKQNAPPFSNEPTREAPRPLKTVIPD